MTESQQAVSNWLRAVGQDTGLSMNLGEDGHCTVLFGEEDLECVVEAQDDSDLCFIYIPLVRAPDRLESKVVLLQAALEMNMFSLATGGASVSYDPRSDYVVLTFAFTVPAVDEEFFKKVLGDMLDLGVDLYGQFQSVVQDKQLNESEDFVASRGGVLRI
jgi:hypothetical protein